MEENVFGLIIKIEYEIIGFEVSKEGPYREIIERTWSPTGHKFKRSYIWMIYGCF